MTRLLGLGYYVRFWILKSLQLDWGTLRLRSLPLPTRLRFIVTKYIALPGLRTGRPQSVRAGHVTFHARDAFDLGSLQSCLVDIEKTIIAERLLGSVVQPVMIDVGANVGQFSTAFKVHYPDARIIALEPDPQVFAQLVRNLDRLGGVRTICTGAGSTTSRSPLFRHPVSLMSTLSPGGSTEYEGVETVEVAVGLLDDLLADVDHIDLLKIDVEGHESEVLAGATAVLARTDYLLLELSLNRTAAAPNLAVLAQVADAGPDARILRFGRPLGGPDPICQDVLFQLR